MSTVCKETVDIFAFKCYIISEGKWSILKNRLKIKNMTHIALYSIVITVCSWIAIPTNMPITLQTLGIYFVIFYAGGGKATLSILVYIALGLIGLPVFAGFNTASVAFASPVSGYIIGFIVAGGFYFVAELIFPKAMKRGLVKYSVAAVGLLSCYALGAYTFYLWLEGEEGYWSCFFGQILVYGLVDTIKIAYAAFLSNYLKVVKA